jgi:FkbM family methyltransferase
MVAVDVGANIGLFTLALAKRVEPDGAVWAFEPDPANRALLQENVAANGLGDLVTVSELALTDATGQLFFQPSPTDASASHLAPGGIRVEAVRLDDLDIEHVDVMKIDVEGAECSVLRGAAETLSNSRPALLLECAERNLSRAGSSLGELEDLLRELRYEYLDPDGSSRKQLPTNANVLCLPRSH